jgi:hypothetical protein
LIQNLLQLDSIIARSQRSKEFCNTFPPKAAGSLHCNESTLWAKSGPEQPQQIVATEAAVRASTG